MPIFKVLHRHTYKDMALPFPFEGLHWAVCSHCTHKGSQQGVALQADEDPVIFLACPREDTQAWAYLLWTSSLPASFAFHHIFACWVRSPRISGLVGLRLLMFTFVVKVTGLQPEVDGSLQENLSSQFPVVLGSGTWLRAHSAPGQHQAKSTPCTPNSPTLDTFFKHDTVYGLERKMW